MKQSYLPYRLLLSFGWWIGIGLFSLQGQPNTHAHCGFDRQWASYWHLYPDYMQRMQQEQDLSYRQFLEARSNNHSGSRSNCEIFTIPIVFHIFYDDQLSNISDAQVLSQLEVLNNDYRKIFGTNGYGDGADSRIQFCLATLDPEGNPTSGINRIPSTFTNHLSNQSALLKGQSSWPDDQYLNIWVVKSVTLIDGTGQNPPEEILGYATFPGTPGSEPEGVVIAGKYLGTTGSAIAPYNLGRTCTHEVGHFFGLFHPFEDNGQCVGTDSISCINNGDRVCDTPPETGPTFGCPVAPVNSCVEVPCDEETNLSNFMNFTDDICMNHFTSGQVKRMEMFLMGLRSSLHSPGNLALTGCSMTAPLLSKPTAAFEAERRIACSGESLQFSDLSGGCIDNWNWSFEGGVPSSSNDQHPQIQYPQAGDFKVRLIVENAGFKDSLEWLHYIQVSGDVQQIPFQEGFEQLNTIPSGWKLIDQDEKGSWTRNNLASVEGQRSLALFHYDFPSCGSNENLITKAFTLKGLQTAKIAFSYAYQARNASIDDADGLSVEISTDCGQNFTPLFQKEGEQLATVSGFKDAFPFVPAKIEDWETEVLDLQAYLGQENCRIRFRSFGKNGQNLFLDNIQFFGTVGIDDLPLDFPASIVLHPNPFQHSLTYEINMMQTAPLRLSLTDLMGREIWSQHMGILAAGSHQLNLEQSLSHLPVGIYLLKSAIEKHSMISRIIKH